MKTVICYKSIHVVRRDALIYHRKKAGLLSCPICGGITFMGVDE